MNAKLAGLVLGMGMSVAATADTYHFTPINQPGNTLLQALGQQLTMNVASGGDSTVLFTFTDQGNIASAINKVFIDDAYPNTPSLFSGVSTTFTQSAGVSFHEGSSPPILQGTNGANFGFTPTVAVGANLPQTTNGINNTASNGTTTPESLTLTATLNSGRTFADVINSLNAGGPNDPNFLRVGLRVINSAGAPERVSFLDTGTGSTTTGGGTGGTGGGGGGATPPPPIPEPSTYGMLLAGLGFMATMIRRRRDLLA